MMHSKNDNVKFTSYNDINEVVNELFDSLRSKYQITSERLMRGSNFIFGSAQFLHYKCHEVNFRRGGLYNDSSDWVKKKTATVNHKNTDDKCFQYTVTVPLNYKKTESYPESVSNIKPFINKYNWKERSHPSKIED